MCHKISPSSVLSEYLCCLTFKSTTHLSRWASRIQEEALFACGRRPGDTWPSALRWQRDRNHKSSWIEIGSALLMFKCDFQLQKSGINFLEIARYRHQTVMNSERYYSQVAVATHELKQKNFPFLQKACDVRAPQFLPWPSGDEIQTWCLLNKAFWQSQQLSGGMVMRMRIRRTRMRMRIGWGWQWGWWSWGGKGWGYCLMLSNQGAQESPRASNIYQSKMNQIV